MAVIKNEMPCCSMSSMIFSMSMPLDYSKEQNFRQGFCEKFLLVGLKERKSHRLEGKIFRVFCMDATPIFIEDTLSGLLAHEDNA